MWAWVLQLVLTPLAPIFVADLAFWNRAYLDSSVFTQARPARRGCLGRRELEGSYFGQGVTHPASATTAIGPRPMFAMQSLKSIRARSSMQEHAMILSLVSYSGYGNVGEGTLKLPAVLSRRSRRKIHCSWWCCSWRRGVTFSFKAEDGDQPDGQGSTSEKYDPTGSNGGEK